MAKKEQPQNVIEYYPNGDPYGSGYQASQSTDGGKTWYYRGDIGPAPLRVWRQIAARERAKLKRR